MFITKMALPRRTFLRGLGADVGAAAARCDGAGATASAAGQRPSRFGFVYMPHGARHGVVDADRGRQRVRAVAARSQSLKPFKDSTVVVTNLKRAGAATEMHAAAACGWLSGAIPKETEGEDYEVGTTIDQVLAKQIGAELAVPVARARDRRLHGLRRRLHTRVTAACT